eukprot:scaffold18515_cov28-Tisochrysis_lutea.AAC.1
MPAHKCGSLGLGGDSRAQHFGLARGECQHAQEGSKPPAPSEGCNKQTRQVQVEWKCVVEEWINDSSCACRIAVHLHPARNALIQDGFDHSCSDILVKHAANSASERRGVEPQVARQRVTIRGTGEAEQGPAGTQGVDQVSVPSQAGGIACTAVQIDVEQLGAQLIGRLAVPCKGQPGMQLERLLPPSLDDSDLERETLCVDSIHSRLLYPPEPSRPKVLRLNLCSHIRRGEYPPAPLGRCKAIVEEVCGCGCKARVECRRKRRDRRHAPHCHSSLLAPLCKKCVPHSPPSLTSRERSLALWLSLPPSLPRSLPPSLSLPRVPSKEDHSGEKAKTAKM